APAVRGPAGRGGRSRHRDPRRAPGTPGVDAPGHPARAEGRGSMSGHLAFERLVIRRMPGFPSGGITLDELSPGVNIVYGPNASGKTTTARALQAALWPRTAPDRASILASFRLGAEEWLVDVDAGHARYQRDGRDAHEPALPVADSRDRYVLSLHELIGAEDRELAAIIARESAGGYDLAAAANALKFNTPSARTARTESQALETAR